MNKDELTEAVAALGLQETRPMDLIAAGKSKEVERLATAVADASGHLMMSESYLVKGDLEQAHKWLVKARWALAEVGR